MRRQHSSAALVGCANAPTVSHAKRSKDGTEGRETFSAEVKNEAGEGGCDPAAQAAYDYTALAVSDKASGARFLHGITAVHLV
jgi:hypothetical protein